MHDELKAYGFCDYGSVSQERPTETENPHNDLLGVGPGLVYRVDRFLEATSK